MDDGTIDRTKKIRPTTAMKLLKKKVIDEGWHKSNILTERQIRSLFSRCKNDRTKKGHKAMKEIDIRNIAREVANVVKKEAVETTIKEVKNIEMNKEVE